MNIAVIGLGLMGASLAGALKGFRGARIIGADRRPEVCRQAEEAGLVDWARSDAGQAMAEAEVVIFCVYARSIPEIIRANLDRLRPGLVLADICGVKSRLYPALKELLPPSVEYIGLHPMAGKERDGFENADPAIYRNCGFIICPVEGTSGTTVQLMEDLARHIGAANISVASPERQDEIIAYTSGLMHIAAAGLCLDFHPQLNPAFTAGAFRDCTRVADINAGAWTELLMDNPATLDWLDRYLAELTRFRQALADSDEDALRGLLESAGANKRKMLQSATAAPV